MASSAAGGCPRLFGCCFDCWPSASYPQRPAVAWEPEGSPAAPPLGSRVRSRRGVVTRHEQSLARAGPLELVQQHTLRVTVEDTVQWIGGAAGRRRHALSGLPRQLLCPLSHTLRGVRAPRPAPPGSRARFIFPRNSSVWVSQKIDSRPHDADADTYRTAPRAPRPRP